MYHYLTLLYLAWKYSDYIYTGVTYAGYTKDAVKTVYGLTRYELTQPTTVAPDPNHSWEDWILFENDKENKLDSTDPEQELEQVLVCKVHFV
jgi:hypothetical protein